jgi:hypothetical protein
MPRHNQGRFPAPLRVVIAFFKSPPKYQKKSLSADYTDYTDWKKRGEEFLTADKQG